MPLLVRTGSAPSESGLGVLVSPLIGSVLLAGDRDYWDPEEEGGSCEAHRLFLRRLYVGVAFGEARLLAVVVSRRPRVLPAF